MSANFPTVAFPVPFEAIPTEVKKLTEFIAARKAEITLATKMLEMVRGGCTHAGAKSGFNERDGFWMNPCPHCGHSE